ncbi:hypothetical protein [Streptomyces sp. NPDC046832]|uniref:hypothetical protein n=1 Tax=Streptomyces sp. NPDC046832 TaxID=3155020 RepID=UPI0033F2E85F
MTTCSSPPGSNEPAVPDDPHGSAQPSAETTAATGTHQVVQRSAQGAAAEPVTLGSHPAVAAGTQPPARVAA